MFFFAWWHTWIWSSEYRHCLGMSSTPETICLKVSKKTCCIYIFIFASFIHIFNHFCQLSVSFIKINTFLILSKSPVIILLTYLTNIVCICTHTHTHTHTLICHLTDEFPICTRKDTIIFPWLFSSKEFICQCRRQRFNPCIGKIPWKRKWQPTPGFLYGKSYEQMSLTGYNPWGHKESDMT